MRAPLLIVALGFLSLTSCKPTTACDAKSCPLGCCDASGACQAGNTNQACGTSAATCAVCSAGNNCNLGICALGGTGGGTGAGGGGGSGGGGGGGGGSSAITQLCTDYSNAYIDRLVRCGEVTDALATLYKPLYAQQCMSTPPPGLKDGRSQLDQTAAQACLASYGTASCLENVSCGQEIIRGLVAFNGDCFDDLECQDAFYCDTSTTCPGKCLNRVAVGMTPTGQQRCVKTAYVYQTACVALVAAGQSCAPMGGQTFQQSCAGQNFCSAAEVCGPAPLMKGLNESCATGSCGTGLQCVANVCVARVSENGACDSVRRCKDGLRCSTANVCVVNTYGAAGDACGSGGNSCLPDLFCNIPTGMTAGTCAARRPVNGTCTYSGNECASGLSCNATFNMQTGVCKAPGALNDPCTYSGSFSQCGARLYCTATSTMMTGVCANQKGEGASCTQSDECLGTCQSMLCTRPSCYDPTP